MRITAVTCVKNEGPFLLEWIAFNRLIGVTDFLFYSNDCTDGTDLLLDRLAAHGVVHHLPNPAEGRHYQMAALKDAKHQPLVEQADWIWPADVDEFLNIHVGDNTIPALVAACNDPQAISISYQYFGNDGVMRFEDRPVIAQFTRSHNPDIWCADLSIEVKTLVRNDFPLKYFGAHRPFFRKSLAPEDQPSWTDGSGRPVPGTFRSTGNERRVRKFPAAGARDFATLNHYALRSLDSFLVKRERGDANRENREFDAAYWCDRADTAFEDMSIARYLPALEKEMSDLKALDGVGGLHEACVRRHRAKVAELESDPDYRALRDTLMAAGTLPPAEVALRAELGLPT